MNVTPFLFGTKNSRGLNCQKEKAECCSNQCLNSRNSAIDTFDKSLSFGTNLKFPKGYFHFDSCAENEMKQFASGSYSFSTVSAAIERSGSTGWETQLYRQIKYHLEMTEPYSERELGMDVITLGYNIYKRAKERSESAKFSVNRVKEFIDKELHNERVKDFVKITYDSEPERY